MSNSNYPKPKIAELNPEHPMYPLREIKNELSLGRDRTVS